MRRAAVKLECCASAGGGLVRAGAAEQAGGAHDRFVLLIAYISQETAEGDLSSEEHLLAYLKVEASRGRLCRWTYTRPCQRREPARLRRL